MTTDGGWQDDDDDAGGRWISSALPSSRARAAGRRWGHGYGAGEALSVDHCR